MVTMKENYISRLKQILQSTGLSQAELARRLGVTFAALNRWLRGHAQPHSKRLLAIEKAYRELVAYPACDQSDMARKVRVSDKYRIPRLWKLIAAHQDVQDDLLLEHTYNSTAIEGTTLTKHETEAVIFAKKILPDKSLIEHLEVSNHAAVLKRILQG